MHQPIIHAALLSALVSGAVALATAPAAIAQDTTGQGLRTQTDEHALPATERSPTGAPIDLGLKDKRFLDKAIRSSAAEVELGELAASKGRSAEVREFGRMMQHDHEEATRDLSALAVRTGAGSEELDRAHARKLEQLRALEGRRFDAAYAETMVDLHRKDVQLFEEVAGDPSYAPEVRQAAEDKLEALRAHLQMAQRLQRDVQQQVAAADED